MNTDDLDKTMLYVRPSKVKPAEQPVPKPDSGSENQPPSGNDEKQAEPVPASGPAPESAEQHPRRRYRTARPQAAPPEEELKEAVSNGAVPNDAISNSAVPNDAGPNNAAPGEAPPRESEIKETESKAAESKAAVLNQADEVVKSGIPEDYYPMNNCCICNHPLDTGCAVMFTDNHGMARIDETCCSTLEVAARSMDKAEVARAFDYFAAWIPYVKQPVADYLRNYLRVVQAFLNA